MIFIDDQQAREHLHWMPLIEAIAQTLRTDCSVAPRVHHELPVPGAPHGTLLLMPAWVQGRFVGVKVVTVFPGNASRGAPTVSAIYLLFDGTTGVPLAYMAASVLTARRTAAASALAARYLARTDAQRLLIVGTGRVAAALAAAHSAVRPIREVAVWGRTPERAEQLARRLRDTGLAATAVSDLQQAVARADIVSCATLSQSPLVHRAWVGPGTHIDLVGAFKPSMREADDALIGSASLFVDTRVGAVTEAGEIVQAIARGVIAASDICADLGELVNGVHPGRSDPKEVTVFKSVGMACEDLAAAVLILESLGPTVTRGESRP